MCTPLKDDEGAGRVDYGRPAILTLGKSKKNKAIKRRNAGACYEIKIWLEKQKYGDEVKKKRPTI